MAGRRYFIAGQEFEAPELAAGLHVVATPIGNLRDMTLRALEVLAAADVIYCEDTRTSSKLTGHFGIATPRKALHEHNERALIDTVLEDLKRGGRVALEVLAAADVIYCEDTRTSSKLTGHFGIATPRKALHEHNERALIDTVLEDLKRGGRVALISDAGTPLVSDPGFPLVRAAREADLPVFAAPGASALLAALAVAGLPTDAFSFLGFLPPKAAGREAVLRDLAGRRETLAFYESPRRLGESLSAMAAIFGGDRPAAVALELTKLHERVARGTLDDLAARFAGEEKGEAVILVGGAVDRAVDADEWGAALAAAMETQPLRAAVDEVTDRFGLKRKDVYDAALALKAGR